MRTSTGGQVATVQKSSPRTGSTRKPGEILATRVGLEIPEDVSYEDWENAGAKLVRIADSSAWCLGDWLVHGQSKFADRYSQAIKNAGLDYQTLRNYAWVARKFHLSRRRHGLSFQHHAEVASMDPEEQDKWLTLAENCGWSRNELRTHIRCQATKEKKSRSVLPRLSIGDDQVQRWREAAARSGCSLEAWLISTLNEAAAEVLHEPADQPS